MSAQVATMTHPEADIQYNRPEESNALSYGYVRADHKEFSEAEQRNALCNAGVTDDCLFIDRSASSSPTEYSNVINALHPGDVFFIMSLDMLGITYDEIIAQWQYLTHVKQANMVVLNIPLLDTRKIRQDALHYPLVDLVLQMLAYASSREREGIRQRQREGILAAKERGVRFGRPPKPIPPQFERLLAQWKRHEISSRKAAQQLGVAQETFLRWSRKYG